MALIPQSLDTDNEISVETREISPSHFLVRIESFSSLSKTTARQMYETTEFEAGGCKWKLVIYPNGLESGNNGDHVSVYLAVADSTSLPERWEEVNAIFAIFLHNRKSDNFHHKQGGLRRFHALNQCWGFSKFITKKSLMDPLSGYVVKDRCTFGAEVFVLNSQGVTGRLIMPEAEMPYKRTWRIPEFSKLPDKWESEGFYVGEHNWKLTIYPRGHATAKDSSISLFLKLVELKHPNEEVNVSFEVRISDQINGKHCSKSTSKLFNSTEEWGWSYFLPIKDMNDPEKGFLVEDCSIVEIEMTVLSEAHKSN